MCYNKMMNIMRLLLCFVIFSPALGQAASLNKGVDRSARDLVKQVQDRMRSESSIITYNMRIETADWQREMRLKGWDDRIQKQFFIRILAPKKDKNTTWLKKGANLWMYLPKLERDIRIPPSMMLSNWMGSDFSNDDLIKMQSVVKDYTHKIVADDHGVVTVESIPRPDAPVVWGKIIRRISHQAMPLREDYFDEHGRHIRQLIFDQVQHMGGRDIPTRWTMQADATPNKRTVMVLEHVVFDAVIDENIFTRRNMRR